MLQVDTNPANPPESGLKKTREYVSKNVVKARVGRKCVDGRYLPTQSSGMIARPGGDCGYVMALLAVNKKKNLGLTPEQCFNAVYKAVSNGQSHNFCMHTDSHCDPDTHTHKGLIGCGHLVKASTENLCSSYDVACEDVKRFVEYARNIADIEPKIEMINLQGEHAEKGVLVIKSHEYTVNAEDPELNTMYFVYDLDRDLDFMKKLVEDMSIEGVDFEEFKKESDLQLTATLHNLALGLPVYEVNFQNSTPQVSLQSFVK